MKRLLIALGITVFSLSAAGQELFSRRTEQLNLVYYDKAHEYLTYHLVRSYENSLDFHRRLFNYTPSEPVVMLMQDFGDYGHGGTSTVPWNYISIGIEPFDYVYDTMPANERMNWLMHHELVHVVATDKGADSDLRWRRLFRGKVAPVQENPLSMFYSFLTSPRWYSPRWYHEGIAVFLETWMAGGVGRSLGGYDEMVFRTMALEDSYFYDVVGLESEGTTIDFQVGQNSYLYGTRFVTWLAAEHGPEKVIAWFDRSSGSKRYFASQFRHVYGKSLHEEWQRWIDSEREWQKRNVALIRQYPVTTEQKVSSEIFGSVSRSFHDPAANVIYAAINRPAKPAQIVSISLADGSIRPLTEVGVPSLYFVTSIAYDPKGKKIFFTSDNARGWRDLNELDLASGRTRMLLKDSRAGDLVVNPADQSIWGVQHHNGISSLIRIPPPYTGWQTIMALDYGRDIFDLDISPDGKRLSCSMIEVSGRMQLVTLEIDALMRGESPYDVLHEFENNTPANFTFSPDGRYLYGTSYYTGVSNVFRYDFETRKMEALSNAETGLFRPLPVGNDRLLAWRYTAKGFSPVTIPMETREDINAINYLGQEVVEKHPIVKEWNAGSPARIDLDEKTTFTGPYNPIAQLGLGSIYPVLEGYKDSVAAGFRADFADPLGLHSVDLTLAYTPDDAIDSDEKLHANLGWSRAPWDVRLKYNATDFYDLFGPTKQSRKGHSGEVNYHRYLVYEKPRTVEYTLSGAYYGGLDTLPDAQNVRAPFEEYATVGGKLKYTDIRRTIGAIEPERGMAWSLAANGSYVNSEFFPRLYGTLDRGTLVPGIEHSSLWLRTAAGKSWGDRDNAFASFFFGGFGNNWIDYQEVSRYRAHYAFPGVELNEIGGTDFGKATLEWTLPPIRFQSLGRPSFYANWARVALFSSALVTDVGESDLRQDFYNGGAQLDVSLVMFSNLESTFSVGYARAFDGDDSSDEVMVSLKLLR